MNKTFLIFQRFLTFQQNKQKPKKLNQILFILAQYQNTETKQKRPLLDLVTANTQKLNKVLSSFYKYIT